MVYSLDRELTFLHMSCFSPEQAGEKRRGDGTDIHPWQRGGIAFLEAGLWHSRRRRTAASSSFPQPCWHMLCRRLAKEMSPSGRLIQLSPPQGLKLSSWIQSNKGCFRCQQIPGNEPGMYRRLSSPTSWRGTQQPLKLIMKYVVFTQKAFCSKTCAIWAQVNTQRDTSLLRHVQNLNSWLKFSFLKYRSPLTHPGDTYL